MCRVISVANIKGGVAKTTSAINLGTGLVRKGKKVLLIDLDAVGRDRSRKNAAADGADDFRCFFLHNRTSFLSKSLLRKDAQGF